MGIRSYTQAYTQARRAPLEPANLLLEEQRQFDERMLGGDGGPRSRDRIALVQHRIGWLVHGMITTYDYLESHAVAAISEIAMARSRLVNGVGLVAVEAADGATKLFPLRLRGPSMGDYAYGNAAQEVTAAGALLAIYLGPDQAPDDDRLVVSAAVSLHEAATRLAVVYAGGPEAVPLLHASRMEYLLAKGDNR